MCGGAEEKSQRISELKTLLKGLSFKNAIYINCRKYVPIDLVNLSRVIASEAKQFDAKHRPEQSRGIPRLTRDDPLGGSDCFAPLAMTFQYFAKSIRKYF